MSFCLTSAGDMFKASRVSRGMVPTGMMTTRSGRAHLRSAGPRKKQRDTREAAFFFASSMLKQSKFKIQVPSYRTPKNSAKQLVMKYFEQVWNEGDTGILTSLCADSVVFLDITAWPEPYIGPAAVTKVIEEYLSAYKSIRFSEIELLASDDGSVVTARWKATAFHLGVFLGKPASGRVQEIKGMTSFSIANDKVARIETFREQLIHERVYADYGM